MSIARRSRTFRGAVAALFALAAVLAVPAFSGAATFNVNTTSDVAPAAGECSGASGDCSLRQAIDAANTAGGANAIAVPAGTYQLTIPPEGGDDNDSGDLDVTGGALTIEGAGARHTVIDASSIEDRVLQVEGSETSLALSGLTITGGRTSGSGGGISAEGTSALSLDGVAVTDNESFNEGRGGGIRVSEGVLHIVDSTLSGNRNSGDGGAISGVELRELSIEDSTIADNVVDTALYPLNESWGAYGGGMEITGNTLVMKNATIAGNQIIDGNGGGSGFGAALYSYFSESEVVNTIIADNTATEVYALGQCTETFDSLGHNLETEAPEGEFPCFEGSTNLVADPLLSALANNGGETDTMALASNSPAVDTGDSSLCLPTDQRGYSRPVGSGCDIGAYEYGASPAVTPTTETKASTTAAVTGGWFGIKKIKRNTTSGTLKLGVKFNMSGTATISGKGVKTVTKSVAAGLSYISLVPTGSVKSTLARTGKAKATVTVSFKTAANTFTKTKTVVFRLAR